MAILPHDGNSDAKEISFQPGDIIGTYQLFPFSVFGTNLIFFKGVAGNHWNGYSKGVNRRSQESGLYPGYKVAEVVRTEPFKSFSDRISNFKKPDDS